jgi:Tetratricopeptide repeat
VYTDSSVAELISQHFVPARVHVRDNADAFKQLGQRFSAQWTPTILIADSEGKERHRIEGFLPVDDLIAQLTLGLAHSAFARGKFAEAEPLFRRVSERHSNTEAAPEALYWAGVSRYKATNDPDALGDTARAFQSRYTETSWAKKASVWNK